MATLAEPTAIDVSWAEDRRVLPRTKVLRLQMTVASLRRRIRIGEAKLAEHRDAEDVNAADVITHVLAGLRKQLADTERILAREQRRLLARGAENWERDRRRACQANETELIRGHGTRTRASRGRPVRRRGSRRTPAATRAGPEAGDPEPAGFGAPVGDTSRVDALAGRPT